ncbi:hypothetical protein AWB77_02103 [Caballeronia fortuita]|uniref:Uncharacterized protein n=1 Tax=Caballeronia fortuita TaxID=1777138 RepID=A0A158ATR3_9BURK|nr:hypothetical protein AWB77_02103 [Caballeronia fortuita]
MSRTSIVPFAFDGTDGSLIGESPAFRQLVRMIDRIAPTELAVLVSGRPAPARNGSRVACMPQASSAIIRSSMLIAVRFRSISRGAGETGCARRYRRRSRSVPRPRARCRARLAVRALATDIMPRADAAIELLAKLREESRRSVRLARSARASQSASLHGRNCPLPLVDRPLSIDVSPRATSGTPVASYDMNFHATRR